MSLLEGKLFLNQSPTDEATGFVALLLNVMCNCYDLSNKHIPWHTELERLTSEAVSLIGKPLNIRKTDPGIVARLADDKLEVLPMRWGFHRSFNPCVNNSREDKLESQMWAEAWKERRCVAPIADFYEWSGPKGRKQTHAFTGETDCYLWAAGLWEEDHDHGPCYSIITVNANPVTEPIHNRMPALLAPDEIDEFLAADDPRNLLRPYEGYMKTFPCQNPLKMKEPSPPISMEVEQELF